MGGTIHAQISGTGKGCFLGSSSEASVFFDAQYDASHFVSCILPIDSGRTFDAMSPRLLSRGDKHVAARVAAWAAATRAFGHLPLFWERVREALRVKANPYPLAALTAWH